MRRELPLAYDSDSLAGGALYFLRCLIHQRKLVNNEDRLPFQSVKEISHHVRLAAAGGHENQPAGVAGGNHAFYGIRLIPAKLAGGFRWLVEGRELAYIGDLQPIILLQLFSHIEEQAGGASAAQEHAVASIPFPHAVLLRESRAGNSV